MVRVADVVGRIDGAFPVERAEQWDVVGLSVGDPNAEVTGVLVTLDPTVAALGRAEAIGANVVLTHHPAFLTPPSRLTPVGAPVAFEAARRGIALIAAHTNLDRDPVAALALPRLLGIPDGTPIEGSLLDVSLVTVYVPPEYEVQVAEAMTAAGAGRIGEYTGCSFAAPGTGRFTPSSASDPAIGVPGEPSQASEVRLEAVCAPHIASAVVRSATTAHPYEEPLIGVSQTSIARGAARMGRLSVLPESTQLEAVASTAAKVFAVAPRVWGEPSRVVDRVATATGSAGSLVRAARKAGADVLLAGEVRYHDALDALESGLAVIEIGHDVSEWPLVEVLASAARSTEGLDPDMVTAEAPSAGWWTP